MLRSMLFVPGDSEKKLSRAESVAADALILDLEDAVAPDNKLGARQLLSVFLAARPRGQRSSELWVRINGLDSGMALADLAAVIPAAPDGIFLPKANGPEDVLRLSYYIDALETVCGLEAGSIRILPVATETAVAPFNLGGYATGRISRLFGLTWGAEDLSAAIGAITNVGPDGRWTSTYRMVRSLTLLAASAAGVAAIETLYANYDDEAGLRASCRAAREEGFTGRIAIHPAQVAVINESFVPSPAEIVHAERIVAAFAAAPGMGTVGLDGRMIDSPHLKQAQATLARAAATMRR